MFGFLIGVIVTVVVLAAMRRRRGRSWHHPRQWFARRVFEHLDTMPAQESALYEEWLAVRELGLGLPQKMEQSRSEAAVLLRAEQFDVSAMDALVERQKVALDELFQRAKSALQKTHQTLNPTQRSRAADLLQWGARAFFHRSARYNRAFARPDRYAW
jgi:Heavy-metal resistance